MAGLAYVRSRLTWDHAVRAVRRAWPSCGTVLFADSSRGLQLKQRTLPTGPRPPLTALRSRLARERQRVSLCMIVKNEAEHLAASLGSVADLVDEVVVVDTGSTDATAAIAGRFGCSRISVPMGRQLRRGAQ